MAGNLNENLKDFNLWYRYSASDGLTAGPGSAISLSEDGLICAISGAGLFLKQGASWANLNLLQTEPVGSMVNTSRLVITTGTSIYFYQDKMVSLINTSLSANPVDGLFDNGITWVGDLGNGLISIDATSEISLLPNGPANNELTKLRGLSTRLTALSPAHNAAFNPLKNDAGVSVFENEQWVVYSSSAKESTISIPEFLDVTDAYISDDGSQAIFSSFGYGLLTIEDGISTIIDENSPGSPLENTMPPERNVYISSLSTNYQGVNMLNYEADVPLHRLTNDGQWQSFMPGFTNAKYGSHLLSTPWDDHWIVLNPSFGGGLVLFNESGSSKYLSTQQGNGGLPSSTIHEIILDKENKMWVATDRGVVYYPFPESLIDEPIIDPVLPIYEQNILFSNQKVTALAVDGGNRIWMATDQGAWLFEDDGQTLVANFNIDNSPLLSNSIHDIAIVDATGEVFFATDKGLISFRGTSTAGIEAAEMKIYPNPVYPGYSGLITMERVPENAVVTITDVSGRLVYKTTSEGNTAVWDGRDAYGQTVPTGVYFVFITNEDKSRKQAGKIVFIN